MRGKLFMASVALSTAVTAGLCGISFGSESQAPPIGRITAAFGHTRIQNETGARPCDLHALVNNDDRIVTNGGGISVLLASRVVLKLDAGTCVAVREGAGETSIVLEYGTVQVFVGQRPADFGKVVLIDPQTRVEAGDGVFLASYNPETRESYTACEQKTIMLRTDGQDPISLPADEQAIVREGKLASNGQIDRLAFLNRKQSFEQLGQSALAQGANTFRLRSRTFDTEVALSQLSAAGWIDRQALVQAQTSQPLSREADETSQESTTSTEEQKTEPTRKPAKPNKSNPTDTAIVANPDAPAVAQTPAPQTPAPQAPVAPPIVSETPITQIPVETAPSKPAPIATPASPPVAIDLAPDIAPSTPVVTAPPNIGGAVGNTGGNTGGGVTMVPVDAPSLTLDNHGSGKSGGHKSGSNKGKSGKGGSASGLPAVETTKSASVPKIDLNIGGSSTPSTPGGASGGSNATLGLPGGASGAPAVTPAATSTPKININLPKFSDIAGTTKNAAPPTADLGIGAPNPGSGNADSGSPGSGATPPAVSIDTPALPPKIDLTIDAPTPKLGLSGNLNIPKMDGAAGSMVPNVDSAVSGVQTPVIAPGDLNLAPKGGAVAPDAALPPPPTAGGLPAAPTGANGAVPALPTPTEAGAAPPPAVDTASKPAPAPEVSAPQRQDAAEKAPTSGKKGGKKGKRK